MPRMKVVNGKKVRDYSQQREYNATPEATSKRVANNSARAGAIKAGKASRGDGKDVDHKVPLSKGGSNAPSNLRVVSASSNRSFSRTSSSAIKSQTSKRERKKK
jgi:5-methylcytosine-specific restriction endonuclease McrA